MSDGTKAFVSLLLIAASFYFVASEYALVGSRKNRLEQMARKGNKIAARILKLLENTNQLVAASQIAITMIGIGLGSVTEPFLTDMVSNALSSIPRGVSQLISYVIITFVVVVLGELVPKFAVISAPERWALITTIPLSWVGKVTMPLVWLAQNAASGILKPFGVKTAHEEEPLIVKEELQRLVRQGQSDLEAVHANFVVRALRFDDLDAKDVMVHRLDMRFIDVSTPKDQILGKIGKIPHSRIPVCRGDLDDLVGVVYVNDIVRTYESENFSLEKICRPPIVVPENLTLDKVVSRMREDRTQILIVVDEYGGTSGLITLEDVVEEIFGELEDKLESERPPIETHKSGRISAKSDVRYDELVDYLGLDIEDPSTDTLAQMFVDYLERVPKMGDQIDTPIGKMRVENMARRRVTRVSILLKKPQTEESSSSD
jgi:putative hemolysin